LREWTDAGENITWDLLMGEALGAPSEGFVFDCNAPAFAERGEMVAKIANACRAVGASAPRSRGSLVRLVLESLADSYRRTLDELESLTGMGVTVVHVVGGGSRNALLNQLTADACGRRVVAGPAEATALGNLLVQARALGHLPEGASVREVAMLSTDTFEYKPAGTVRDWSPLLSVL
jgi:rhamnulokinase